MLPVLGLIGVGGLEIGRCVKWSGWRLNGGWYRLAGVRVRGEGDSRAGGDFGWCWLSVLVNPL